MVSNSFSKKTSSTILLINPWIYDFAAYDFRVKPLGLLSIASVLRKNGYEIHLIDCLDRKNIKGKDSKELTRTPRRKYGAGHFFKTHIEKPSVLREIPRNYSRYGITPELFEQQLQKVPKPDVVLVTSMMTYWYL